MKDISAVALFCSDVREERGSTVTIVGVYPDNVNVPNIPGSFPTMSVYVRIHLRSDFDPPPLSVRIVLPDGKEIGRSDFAPETVATARAKAKDSGAPSLGLIATFSVAPMHITKAGRVEALVTMGEKEYVVGSLNVQLSKPKAT